MKEVIMARINPSNPNQNPEIPRSNKVATPLKNQAKNIGNVAEGALRKSATKSKLNGSYKLGDRKIHRKDKTITKAIDQLTKKS